MKSQHKVVLSQAKFRRLLLARTISSFGNGMAPTALAFSIFGLKDGSASTLSLVLTAQAIPLVLMLPFGGVYADRMGCLLYTSPSPRDYAASRMPSSA